MKLLSILAVFAGGGLGSVCRYALSRAVITAHYTGRFPIATLLANLGASALLILFIYLGQRYRMFSGNGSLFWIMGFCGGFSTFSTFSYENWLLARSGHYGILSLNILISVVLCLAVIAIGAKLLNVAD